MNNNSKREINFFSRWRVTRYPEATSTPLELWKYANFTKPVFCPFLNHWINFWTVVRVSRAKLGLICLRQIQVIFRFKTWWALCEFLHRMDVDAIFQQINLRYEWAIWVSAILTLNRIDVDMIFFFSFNYSSSLSTSESRAKTRQYLANFSAIPCEPCSWKIEIFSGTVKFSSLIHGGL